MFEEQLTKDIEMQVEEPLTCINEIDQKLEQLISHKPLNHDPRRTSSEITSDFRQCLMQCLD
jgi:hypothetical protein